MKQIILASTSPRRKELLQMIGLPFKAVDGRYEEKLNPRLKPRGNAEALSLGKAQSVAQKHKDAIIIAADTFVVIDEDILGKPKDDKDTKRMLRKLSGNVHEVITGFTVMDTGTGKTVTKSCTTKVWFKKLSKQEIDWYTATGEAKDAAGSYKYQKRGSVFVEKIQGDSFNIIGLPVSMLVEELKRFKVYLT